MKRIVSLVAFLVIVPQIICAAPEDIKGCTRRIAALTLSAVAGASLEASNPRVGRTALVTDLTHDNYDSGTRLLTMWGDIRDGNGLTSRIFCSGSVCLNPHTNKIRSIRFNPGQIPGSFNRDDLNAMAIDAALWAVNSNRPDMGSKTSVERVDDLQGYDLVNARLDSYIDGQYVVWKRVVVKDGSSGRTDNIFVAVDPSSASPIAGVEVRPGWWDWETDQGVSALASMAGRIMADGAMPNSGLRLGNFVTDMAGRDYWNQTQAGILYRGTHSGGDRLAMFEAHFADAYKGLIDSIKLQPYRNDSRPGGPWRADELQPLLRNVALGLHKIIRMDAGDQTRIIGFSELSSTYENNETVQPWIVSVFDPSAASPNYNYRVTVRPDLAHPIRSVSRRQ